MSLSNLSYTNKDFNSIYVELLEYAKKLSDRWDPSASAESDPGVVLLKLAALIGDKDNYNIDKNVLELLPASVSQLPSARQLFDQCGYYMHYYRSAEGTVNLRINKQLTKAAEYTGDGTITYVIPKFTMFTDSESSKVYCTTKQTIITADESTPLQVIEGTPISYTINNDPNITVANLDNKNRLYFTELNIAENGIFVVDSEGTTWERVDNLYVQPTDTKCFKFGITTDQSTCYIEFPENVENLIGAGCTITYIKTSGSNGNIPASKIRQFYADTTVTRSSTDKEINNEEVTLDVNDVTIKNYTAIAGGQDVETIDSAYKAYKRVKNTFDTLVSLKDYSDFIVSSESASNGYVCDRTNDIQSVYKKVTDSQGYKSTKVYVECDTKDKPELNAFNLRIYALEYVPTVDSKANFQKTFKLSTGITAQETIEQSELKYIQHDFKSFEQGRILMLKNKYNLSVNIVPKYTLSTVEKYQITELIEQSLYEALNSKQLEFGKDISLTVIQNAILSSDERLSGLLDFSSLKYETYVVYLDQNNKIQEMRIDAESLDGGYVPVKITMSDFNSNKLHYYYIDPATKQITQCSANSSFNKQYNYYTHDPDLSALWYKFRVDVFAKNVLSGVTPLYTKADSYTYLANQQDTQELQNLTSIRASSTLTLEYDEPNKRYSAEVRDNENILLTCPNLLDESNYSSYVKMLYNFKFPINNNDYHELLDDEYIMFFWKAADTDTDYTCLKYDNSAASRAKIIQLSGFSIDSTHLTNNTVGACTRFDAGSLHKTSPEYNVTLSDGSSMNETDFIKSLTSQGNYEVLTGLKTVKTYKINTIQMNNTTNGCSNCYWIVNNSNNTLFAENVTTYTLQSGEYFMYTDSKKTRLEILGEGTTLSRSKPSNAQDDASKNFVTKEWKLSSKIDLDVLMQEGIDYITNWFVVALSNDLKLEITENQRMLIGPGNTLCLVPKSTSEDVAESVILNSESKSLSNYTIYYIDENNTTQDVPDNNFSNDNGWKGSVIFNLTMSPEVPITLAEGQTITYNNNPTNSITNKTIVSNTSIAFVGDGSNIDVSELNEGDGLDLLSYEINTELTYDSTEQKLTLELNEPSKSFTTKLLQGNYIISFDVADTEISVELSSNVVLTPLNNKSYKFTLANDTDVNFTFTKTDTTKTDTTSIIIWPLFKYTTTTLEELGLGPKLDTDPEDAPENLTFEQSVLNFIKKRDEQDLDNSFYYTNVPENPINNPLVAQTFLDPTHFYNKFTICEWDTTTTKNNIKIHDVMR